jgi:hypothetical protein
VAASSLAALLVGCADASGPAEVPGTGHAFLASGRVHVLSGAVPTGLNVTIVSGSRRVSAPVAADGSFSIQTQVSDSISDIIIDPGPAPLLPALIRVSSRATARGLGFVLVPRSWTVQGGSFHGQTVDVSLDDAFRPPCQTPGDTNCDGFYPRAWTTGVKLWPATRFPVPVAFDHSRSHQSVTPQDSAALHAAIDRANADVGVTMFRAGRVEELALNVDGRPLNGVVIRVDTTLSGFGAWTNWWWDGAGDLYAGVIRARTAAHVRSAPLMTHELLHTLGFKHSCSWTTVMGGYGCGSFQSLSLSDVAYVQLARAVHETQRSTGAQHGLFAGLQGERVVLRGLPLPSLGSVELLRAMRVDSISDGDHAH